ncbi:unnamed protein product, partial [Prorocentrum cordatum]
APRLRGALLIQGRGRRKKAHKDANQGGPQPSHHQQPRGARARQKRPPWEITKQQRQDSELAALRKQADELTAAKTKAKLEALSDLKAELKKLAGGEQAASCVDAVEAKCTEPPKPKSITALQGQRNKLQGQHQKAVFRAQELEGQRAKLDKQISDAEKHATELKAKLESADAEIEHRHAAGCLGDGLEGLAKVLGQFKSTAVDSQHRLALLLAAVAGLGCARRWRGSWRPAADITFVQETRIRVGGREGLQRWHWKRGFDLDLAAGPSTGDGPRAVSGGVGIGVRQQLAVTMLATKCLQPHRVLSRTVKLGDRLAIDLASVYLRDGEGMSEANGDIPWDLAARLRVAQRSSVLAGDFNMGPLQAAAWATSAGRDVLHTGVATCRAGALAELDFAVIADELQPFVFSHGPVPGAPIGPRSPVLLELRGLHADATVQQLHRTARLPFDKAIGCFPRAPLPDSSRGEGAPPPCPKAAMKEWLRHDEAHLPPPFDLHGEGAEKFSGRAEGARFANVPLADAIRRRWAQLSSRATRAWGGLVSSLQRTDLLAARGDDSHSLHSHRSRLGTISIPDYDGSEAPLSRCELPKAATSSDAGLRRRPIEHARARRQASRRSDAAAACKQWQAVEHRFKEWLPLWCDTRRRGGLEEAASWNAPGQLPNLEADDLSYIRDTCYS